MSSNDGRFAHKDTSDVTDGTATELGWLDIGTAPKDGTPISARYEDGSEEDGVYWQAEGRCCILGSRAGSYPPGWTSKEAGNLPVDNISNWKPLPASPTDGDAA